MINLSSNIEPYNDESLMPFGKYKGTKLKNVPDSHLIWLYNNGLKHNHLIDYIQSSFTKEQLKLK